MDHAPRRDSSQGPGHDGDIETPVGEWQRLTLSDVEANAGFQVCGENPPAPGDRQAIGINRLNAPTSACKLNGQTAVPAPDLEHTPPSKRDHAVERGHLCALGVE